jgi:hypothetical protein
LQGNRDLTIFRRVTLGINYGMDTTGEKKKRTSKKTWMEGVQAAMTTRNLEPDQCRNREELRLVSGRR